MFPVKLSRLLKFSNAFLNDLWGTVRNNTDVARQKWFAKLTKSQKRESWTLKLVGMKGINSLIYLLMNEKKEKKVFATVSLWSTIEIFYRDWDFECCDFLFASKKKETFLPSTADFFVLFAKIVSAGRWDFQELQLEAFVSCELVKEQKGIYSL